MNVGMGMSASSRRKPGPGSLLEFLDSGLRWNDEVRIAAVRTET
jgi:hypothetical protein